MARLAFCDYHNMIAILEKYEHNVDFHQIVDFVEASHIMYALTINPTVYVSHIRQFWSTARVETSDDETKILATVDGKPITISESSIRRNLKLKDEAGISSLPDAELFENLTLMGYNISPNQKFTFQKDEPASPLGDDSQGEAFPTVSGLEAKQDRANIIKISTLPHDSPPRVTSLAADEGSMQQKLNELTDLCTRLQRQQTKMASKITAQDLEIASLKARIKLLEDKDGGGDEPSGKDATIKGRSLETREEADVEKSTERGNLSIGERIELINDLLKYQDNYAKFLKYQSQQRKPLSKKQQREFYMSVLKSHSGWKAKHFKGMSLEEIREKFIPVWKQIEDFVPMGSKEE
nr:hypothetical protein [Tanacetum cinerariifolium]